MEIERKYLVARIPFDLDKYPKKELVQGYISSNPVLRLRRSTDSYIFTFKNGESMLEREEFESPLTKKQFEGLWELVSGSTIEKTRYNIPIDNGLIAELDVYYGRLCGLITVEVEFTSVEQANAFTPLDWFGKDVTNDIRYTNAVLSKQLPPK